MHLQTISLFNFKNYAEANFVFSPTINCIVGENGAGKTNLLDAIHYLCLTKSAFGNIDIQHIKDKESFFSIQGQIVREDKNYLIDCSVQQNKGKILRLNKKEYDKISLHIGEFPCVLLMPYDTDLIREGSEIRRKFFDTLIAQANPSYLQALMQYNQLLKQRNSALQYFAENNTIDTVLLEAYTTPLIALNEKIFADRLAFTKLFLPLLQQYYQQIARDKEIANLIYLSDLQIDNNPIDFKTQFSKNLHKDLAAQRTTIGIHKDEYVLQLQEKSIAKYGSQGQQKTYTIAMRLAQNTLLMNLKTYKPIILLDDIFDKLDESRIAELLAYIDSENCGQVFITDARPERTKTLVEKLHKKVKIIEI